jgi:hypothetical protein
MNSPSNFKACKSRRIRSTGHEARTADKFILDLGRKTLKRGARSFGRFRSTLEVYVAKSYECVQWIHVIQHADQMRALLTTV